MSSSSHKRAEIDARKNAAPKNIARMCVAPTTTTRMSIVQ
jgi:hypothetical protein